MASPLRSAQRLKAMPVLLKAMTVLMFASVAYRQIPYQRLRLWLRPATSLDRMTMTSVDGDEASVNLAVGHSYLLAVGVNCQSVDSIMATVRLLDRSLGRSETLAVLMSNKENPATVRKFLIASGLSAPLYLHDLQQLRQFANVSMVPSLLVLNAKGTVVAKAEGRFELRALVEKRLVGHADTWMER